MRHTVLDNFGIERYSVNLSIFPKNLLPPVSEHAGILEIEQNCCEFAKSHCNLSRCPQYLKRYTVFRLPPTIPLS